MKRKLLAGALLLLAACAGAGARSLALPDFQDSWAVLRLNAENEAAATGNAQAPPEIAKADRAVAAGDPVALATVDWPLLDSLVDANVSRQLATGELGPVPAGSRRERLRLFIETRNRLIRRGL